MAGILRPVGVKEEVPYTIHNYRLGDPAENLFNGGNFADIAPPPYAGTSSRKTQNWAYWLTTGDYLDITFHKQVNIWDIGAASGAIGALTIYNNSNGVKGEPVGRLESNIQGTDTWKLVASLLAGRYIIEKTSEDAVRISYEWYLELAYEELSITIPTPEIEVPKNTDAVIPYTITAPGLAKSEIVTSVTMSELGSGYVLESGLVDLGKLADITKMEMK